MPPTANVNTEKPFVRVNKVPSDADGYTETHCGIVKLLEAARHATGRSINAFMTASYWEVGRRIVEHEQGGNGRAIYGKGLIERLARDLTKRFGRGFGARNLAQMRAFYLAWSTVEILQTGSAKSANLTLIAARFPLPWSAYVQLLSVKTRPARIFYETEALRCGWTVRQLVRQIESQFYERTCLSRNKTRMLAKAERPVASDRVTRRRPSRIPLCWNFWT